MLRNVWSEDDTNRSDLFQWIASYNSLGFM